jgi:hypothetical protein
MRGLGGWRVTCVGAKRSAPGQNRPMSAVVRAGRDQVKQLRFLSSGTLASSTIVRLATFHALFTYRSKSSQQPERS